MGTPIFFCYQWYRHYHCVSISINGLICWIFYIKKNQILFFSVRLFSDYFRLNWIVCTAGFIWVSIMEWNKFLFCVLSSIWQKSKKGMENVCWFCLLFSPKSFYMKLWFVNSGYTRIKYWTYNFMYFNIFI